MLRYCQTWFETKLQMQKHMMKQPQLVQWFYISIFLNIFCPPLSLLLTLEPFSITY